ncbi:MAG: hypothetical protein KC729_18625, partial [Candidatus Eisenbacteria bacterium]|nr:hypothetical protein [Candidatus Eisenbacteria bacterium]
NDPVTEAAQAWRGFLEAPGPSTKPAAQDALPMLRRGLVGYFREKGYWPDDATMPSGVVAAFVEAPVPLRQRIRAWRTADPGWAWQARCGGTPERRRLAAAVLYWLCAPESPEPYWGDWSMPTLPVRWRRESRGLLAVPVPEGPGARERLVRSLDSGGGI